MVRRTICGGLRRRFWSAASVSCRLWLLPLLLWACGTGVALAQAQAGMWGGELPPAVPAQDSTSAGVQSRDADIAPVAPEETAKSVSGGAARNTVALETGLASWYGPGFHRRRTASGERFDMHAMTAAHPTLAFGTLICVRSQISGRGVVVRVNDRGPHARGRIVDLSRAAAMALGLHGLGLKPVELFPLGEGETSCPEG